MKTLKFKKEIKVNDPVKTPEFQNEINVNDEFADLKEIGTLISKYIVSIFSANLLDCDLTNKPSFVLIMEYCNEGSLTSYLERIFSTGGFIPESV